jgi:cell division septum initiation protein DivIVA
MGSETRGSNYDQPATDVSIPEDAGSADQKTMGEDERAASRRSRRFPSSRLTAGERDMILQKARDVDFPVAMRGYERVAVDRYVQQVNRLIAELEMSASPESAVRHALEEVSEETHDLLQRAHQTAEEITARSRSRADERLQQAEQEADAVREAAERDALAMRETVERETAQLRETAEREVGELRAKARREADELRGTSTSEAQELRNTSQREARELREGAARDAEELRHTSQRDAAQTREAAETYARELYRSAEFLWGERRRLVDDMGSVGKQMVDIADAEARRFERLPGPTDVSASGDQPVLEEELTPAAGSSASISEEPDRA